MQSMPLLLRQSFRSSLQLTRTTRRPVQAPFSRPTSPSIFSVRPTSRSFSVCLRCQFRRQPGFYAANDEKDKTSNDAERLVKAVSEAPGAVVVPEADAGASRAADTPSVAADVVDGRSQGQLGAKEFAGQQEKEQRKDQRDVSTDAPSGGLPSYLENRRSRLSKQFTTMMDNVQSNVFVAGQRLNDLTGYSGIEALKNEIHSQENRLREARAQVRKAKDEYTAAINKRSTSQREVNELLQRKHAWSPSDLERFTLLYRNDHTNEVAETETQEALSRAEREAEEAAASLSKSILSRYHEEQVWSDKIRRMSTWGTWGLMGVNVLLFLIFQIAVEPWRRRRLVKGFEDKIVEALEKEKALNRVAAAERTASAGVTASMAPEVIDSTLETEDFAYPVSSSVDIPADAQGIPPPAPNTSISESLTSHLAALFSSPFSRESWQQISRELFNERSITISQRDLTVAAMQSAAAGAAVMGLLMAVMR